MQVHYVEGVAIHSSPESCAVACGWRIANSRYGLANDHGRGRVLFMRDMAILTIHLITIIVKMLRPGGVRAVAAEAGIIPFLIH